MNQGVGAAPAARATRLTWMEILFFRGWVK